MKNNGAIPTRGGEVTLLVETVNTGGSFAFVDNVVALGPYKYYLRQNTDDFNGGTGW